MALPAQFLEELRARVPIADVVGRRVRLTRKGRDESTGLCPFHNEKTPSFTLSSDKGFYHCFGCGAHGDVIGFVMRTEGLEFRPAVEKLAAEAGLSVPRDSAEDRARAERNDTLLGACEIAATWFEQQLGAAVGKPARDYLAKRGIRAETIQQFRLGYAPDSRSALKAALEKAGVTEEIAIEAGLLIKPEDGRPFDRFRARVMFPIMNARGQVIAFGGRLLEGGAGAAARQPSAPAAKYLNSPETPIFHKGRALYALHLAQADARARDAILVVEGYMDVIALWQASIRNAVAPLGTALTEGQIALLWRLASEPLLAFDGDKAGRAAAARAAHRAVPLLQPGRSLNFGWMPEGHDPDSLVREKDAAGFLAAVAEPEPMVAFLWRNATEGRALDTPERRAGLAKDLAALAGQIRDEAVRTSYEEEFRARLTRVKLSEIAAQAAPADQPFETDAWQAADAAQVPAAVRLWFQAALLGRAPVAEWLQSIGCEDVADPPESLRYVGGRQLLAAVQGRQGTVCGAWLIEADAGGRRTARAQLNGMLDHGAVELAAVRAGGPLYLGTDLVQMLHVMAAVRRAQRPGAFWAAIDLAYLAGAPHPDGWKSAKFHPTLWIEPTQEGQRRRRKRLPATMPDMEKPGVIPPAAASEIVLVHPPDGDTAVTIALLTRAAQRFQRMGFKVRMTTGNTNAARAS